MWKRCAQPATVRGMCETMAWLNRNTGQFAYGYVCARVYRPALRMISFLLVSNFIYSLLKLEICMRVVLSSSLSPYAMPGCSPRHVSFASWLHLSLSDFYFPPNNRILIFLYRLLYHFLIWTPGPRKKKKKKPFKSIFPSRIYYHLQ